MTEVGWVIYYLEDVESDLSALHRVEDVDSLSAHRFFSLAVRLIHYQGSVRGRMEEERENTPKHHHDAPNERTEPQAKSSAPPREAQPVRSGTKVEGKTYYNDISHNPELAQYFDH